MRHSRVYTIGRSATVLLAAVFMCAPLAAAAPAKRGDGWAVFRPHTKKVSPTKRAAPTIKVSSAWQRVSANPNGSGGKNGNGNEKPNPSPTPKPTTGSARAGFSIGGGFQFQSADGMTRELDAIKTVGARWVRMDVNWSVIQAGGPSSYDWAPFDRVANAALSRGFSVLAEILYTPTWARSAGAPAEAPPANLDDYVRFARAAVAHYAPMGIHAYEVWNEPNNASFWQPKADVARYTAMLRATYPAIKSADPTAVVVSGGLSPATDDGRNIAPLTFLKGMYANGGKGSFDAVGHHPYCYPAYPGDAQPWSAWFQMYGTSTSFRSLMADNGDSDKQIWATEFGAATDGPSGSYVDEQAQASMLTRAFDLWKSYSWAGPLFWYSQRDLGTAATTRENFYGVLRYDFSPKPAYAAYAAASGA